MKDPFIAGIRSALDAWRTGRARERAVRKALTRFGALHPHWYASCFDATFVHRIGVDAVLAGPSVEVARSWTLQFRYADERTRERDVRQLVPVVDSFATLLHGALEEEGFAPSQRRSGRATVRYRTEAATVVNCVRRMEPDATCCELGA